MSALTPEDCDRLFAERLNAGDLDGVVALYEPRGVLVQQGGEPLTGAAAIRAELAGFLAMKPRLTMQVKRVVRVGEDLAVLYNDWSMVATGPDGSPVKLSGKAIEIVRRQPDGRWLFTVDDPFARD